MKFIYAAVVALTLVATSVAATPPPDPDPSKAKYWCDYDARPFACYMVKTEKDGTLIPCDIIATSPEFVVRCPAKKD